MTSTSRSTATRCRAIAADILHQLQWGPKTKQELIAATGADENTVRKWLRAYRDAGCVRVSGCVPTAKRPRLLYALQTTPFALPDTPRLADQQKDQIKREPLARRPKMPTPDVRRASVWAMGEVQA